MTDSQLKIEPVQKNPIVVQLTRRLLDYVFLGDIKQGDKLPPERQLKEALGVGRSAIREAIKVLTVLGVVEVRQGDGTYLRKSDSGFLIESIEWGLLLGDTEIMDVIEARKEIEVSIVKYAAERCTDEEIKELGSILEKLRISTPEEFVELDIAFHLKLAEMAKNTAFKGVLTSIQSLLRTWIKLVIEPERSTGFSYNDHLKIYEAVSKRDAEGAVVAMQEHMADATRRLVDVINKSRKES